MKISDFGTSKRFDDVSVKMSFAGWFFGAPSFLMHRIMAMKNFSGTVAWMAPEVIRNEPISGKIDVWFVSNCRMFLPDSKQCLINRSYGVILWELLTGQIPYIDVDSSAIIWGVGSDSLSLPIPESCPQGFKLLLHQCW